MNPMAAWFHGAQEIKPDGLQTLFLMNPAFAGYSDASSLNPTRLSQAHHFVGIPIQATTPPPPDSHRSSSIHYDSIGLPSPLDLRPQTRQGLSLRLPEPEIPAQVSSMDLQSVLMGSKFLKAVQQLLDEVVSVGKGIMAGSAKEGESNKNQVKSVDGGENKAAELTAAKRQELQMKKANLINMLDEVEQGYRQYHHQMQIVISSFEAAAGECSARTYTALALQTISKQFRCLRDAITGQIRATTKSLGEEDQAIKSQSSRLQFVDHQRGLQQLGMIQHNAWRAQRGLPERSVSVLRAWLFEHFLHPYPKHSDKQMLAKQTGLTRSQVSNWFINARVRLWKPMVEEMYMEETKEQESNNRDERSSKSESNEDSASKSSARHENSPTRTDQTGPEPSLMHSKFKKARIDESTNAVFKSHARDNEELITKFGSGFDGYPIEEIRRFENVQYRPMFSSNGVSLTLGLTHCDSLSLSGAQPSYLSSDCIPLGRNLEMNTESNGYSSLSSNTSVAHPSNSYDNISIQSRKRFAAQLLQDFVA